jgi:nitrate reductase gamma subunit
MHQVYNFVSGPLVWAAFFFFIVGSLYRLISMIQLVKQKEKWIFSYMSWKYSLRSILHWITPFATVNMRLHPVMTIVTFVFHLCLLITPVFLMAHIILWEEAWSISWVALPNALADVMTFLVVGSCFFFLVRRLQRPEVQYVTSASDYVILAIVAAPFITGTMVYHQWFNYQVMMILHIVSGEIMLVAIPFTRLSHMLFSPLTRAYMGSEFGGIRNARVW